LDSLNASPRQPVVAVGEVRLQSSADLVLSLAKGFSAVSLRLANEMGAGRERPGSQASLVTDATRRLREPSDDRVKVFILDDARFSRDAMAEALRFRPKLQIVGSGDTGSASLATLARLRPEVTLANTFADSAIEVIRTVRALAPRTIIVAMGVQEKEEAIVAFAEAGIDGYITRAESLAALCERIDDLRHGAMPVAAEISARLLREIGVLAGRQSRLAELTPREAEIAELISKGLSNKQIARELEIKVHTVKNHVHHIFDKLGIRNRTGVARLVAESDG
jgi:two-component system nitrate/nitrite response regulator NarL